MCNLGGCNCNPSPCVVFDYTGSSCLLTKCSSADALARFKSIDTDHNGKISPAEITAFVSSQKDGAKRIVRTGLPQNLQAADAKLSDLIAYSFKQTDTNHDGFISAGELDSSLAPDPKSTKK